MKDCIQINFLKAKIGKKVLGPVVDGQGRSDHLKLEYFFFSGISGTTKCRKIRSHQVNLRYIHHQGLQ